MHSSQPEIFRLTETIDRHLAGTAGAPDGIAEVRAALAAFRAKIGPREIERQNSLPACGHLEEALALAEQQSGSALTGAIRAALPYLNWISYNAYPAEEIGAFFPKQHAFASLAWLYDKDYAHDFDLGMMLIAPQTLYRDHRHQAAELYLPLTGPSRWRFGLTSDWETRQAGEPVWNPPYALHATLVDATPMLCLYAWTKNVHAPAVVVPAADWVEIEKQLADA